MGNRLTKIYTKTGDDGHTALSADIRLFKDDIRIEVIGSIDELNSLVGILRAHLQALSLSVLDDALSLVQHELFDLGGELCLPQYIAITTGNVLRLETDIDRMNASLPALKNFILPAGGLVVASTHHTRTVCRRAERLLVSLSRQTSDVSAAILAYVNRLSDWFFVLARHIAQQLGEAEVLWQQHKS